MNTHSIPAAGVDADNTAASSGGRHSSGIGAAALLLAERFKREHEGQTPDLVIVALPAGRREDFLRWLNYDQRYNRKLMVIREAPRKRVVL